MLHFLLILGCACQVGACGIWGMRLFVAMPVGFGVKEGHLGGKGGGI